MGRSEVCEYSKVKKGAETGMCMSPWFFIVFFDTVVKQVNERVTVTRAN